VTFSVAASGTAPLAYQWRKNGSGITGASSSSYTINSVATGDAASYDVVVNNSCGSVTSAPATLTVDTPPSILSQPASATKSVGESVTFSVSATGTGLAYQWRKNDSSISGANGSSHTILSVTADDAGSYDVVVSATCAPATTSAAATLTVVLPGQDFSLSVSPESGTAVPGTSAAYAVRIPSTGPEPFTGLAALSVNGLPAGVTASFTPPFLTSRATGILTLAATGSAGVGS